MSDPLRTDPSPRKRAQALVANMTIDEKLQLVHGFGSNSPYVGNTQSIPRLQVPPLHLEDGPQGVADGVTLVTAWPSTLTVASSWDADLMSQYGAAMAREQRGKGSNVMLGPGVCLARVPTCGRNMEYLGEDPVLAYVMSYAVTAGIQSEGVIATAKHFVANNQEGPGHNGRLIDNAIVSNRSLHELYYVPFEGALAAGAGAVMCSYNLIGGVYACENDQTLSALKNDLDFQGWVMSDWGATHSTVPAALAGLDQEMDGSGFFGTALKKAVEAGDVPMSRLDDMAQRVLTSMIAVGVFDNYPRGYGNLTANVTSGLHNTLARELAEQSTVLVKNEGLLPLSLPSLDNKVIAVVGDANTVSGSGSGHVIPPYVVTPTDGISNYIVANGGSPILMNHSIFTPACPSQCAYQAPHFSPTDIAAAVGAASEASVVILSVATTSGEGNDRANLTLGDGSQDAMVQAVAEVNSNVIVVVRTPGAVRMPWYQHPSIKAVVVQFLPGQEAGNALASVLFGKTNPSGRLPLTFPNSWNETWLQTPSQYPGIKNYSTGYVDTTYSEGLLIGYRWYHQKNIRPFLPFGFGLSYSKFEYSNLQITSSTSMLAAGPTITCDVTNVAGPIGSEVVQLYITFPTTPDTIGEAPRQLRGFAKLISLEPGAVQSASMSLSARDLSVWSDSRHSFVLVPGVYVIEVGASSEDIRLSGKWTQPADA